MVRLVLCAKVWGRTLRTELRKRLWVVAAVVGLLAAYEGQVLHAVHGQSLTWDEGDHIFAGYESWKTHDFGLNPEHPPMVKLVATLPLLALPLKVPALQGRMFKTEAYMDGKDLLFHNGPADGGKYDARTLVWRVRLAAAVFGLVAGLLVFAAGAEMFGVEVGLVALLLFCFEPTLVAHGAYVTTDMAASCTIFGTVYAFWRWVQKPAVGRLVVVGLAGGLALAAKHSTVLLLPMLVLLAAYVVGERWWSRREAGALGRMPRGWWVRWWW
jgi:dolichyl-phosphate-mannose--protein O-mannosyl transferase